MRTPSKFDINYIDRGTTGRGNNWTHGYFDQGYVELMDDYRKVTESFGNYPGMMMIHSLAGGTGSGLGSRLLQEIRDEYPKGCIGSISFCAFDSGETALQNYNSLLSFEVLQRHSDFMGFFSNDQLLSHLNRQQFTSQAGDWVNLVHLQAMNTFAASCLAGMMLPISKTREIGQYSKYFD